MFRADQSCLAGLPSGRKAFTDHLLSMTALSATIAFMTAGGSTSAAWAQTPPPQVAQTTELEEIVVTGSLIVRDGYSAPTPVTVLGIDQIQQSAPANIADYVNALPAMAGGTTTHQASGGVSSQNKGTSTLNLRGLGVSRTLVLINGVRLPPVNLDGSADISGIPEALVRRVDVVTGGASAAYGSDAVAGVVNFVLDQNFTGLRGEVQGGVTTYGDDRSYSIKLTTGTAFGGGRGHVILSGDLSHTDGIFDNDRDWTVNGGWISIANPAYTATNGQPAFLISGGVGVSNAALGGMINAGPLRGIYFGPGGTPLKLNFGSIDNQTYMIGGDWRVNHFQQQAGLDQRLSRHSVLFRANYDISDNVNVYFEANYAQSAIKYQCCQIFGLGSLIVKTDNPFIPPSVAAQAAALKLTTLSVGTYHGDLSPFTSYNTRRFNRYLVGANGSADAFGNTWSWDFFAQKSLGRNSLHLPVNYIKDNYALAIDAVRNANGAIVCRSTLTNPTNGCVPYNLFGLGVNSQAAINYITGEASLSAVYTQSTLGASARSEPFENWAGPISLALGAGYRKDAVRGISDPLSPRNAYFAGNYQITLGSYHVIEGFGETVIPLAKDTVWAKQLDLNAAVRAISYQQAGFVTTWKVGLTYNPIDDVRFRLTRSRDIRAPNLDDLFSGGGAATSLVIDRFLNNINYATQSGTFGNPNLVPEKADTTGLGVVLQPSFWPGFSTSVDYYNIDISGAIASPGTLQTYIDRCYDGQTLFCQSITRNSTTGLIELIKIYRYNFLKEQTAGIDFEASYRTALDNVVSSWSGDLVLRALATHVITDNTDDGRGTTIEKAGTNGGAGPLKWRATFSLTYSNEAFTFSATERLLSAGVFNNEYIVCTTGCPTSTTLHPTYNYNFVAGASYTDMSVTYKFGEERNMEAFLSVQNIADKDPPPTTAAAYSYPANPLFYDTLGRQFRAGVRFKM